MSWTWGFKPKTKRIRSRPKWNSERNHRIPRAFSQRAQWGHSNAAVDRRTEKFEGFAQSIEGLFIWLASLFKRKKKRYHPGPASKQYRVDIK